MVDAVVGSVIMVVATTSLMLAAELVENGFMQAGFQSLSEDEAAIVNGLSGFPGAKVFEQDNSNLFKRP